MSVHGMPTVWIGEGGDVCTHKIPPCDLPLWCRNSDDGLKFMEIIGNLCMERDKLRQQVRELTSAPKSAPCPPPEQYTFMGMKVIVDPLCDNVPKMLLSPAILEIIGPYNPDFCIKMQNWMVEFFGTQDQIRKTTDEHGNNILIIGPRTRDQMKSMGHLT